MAQICKKLVCKTASSSYVIQTWKQICGQMLWRLTRRPKWKNLFCAASKSKMRSGSQTRSKSFAFAQLRAEMSENDAGEGRRSSEIVRICYSHDFFVSSFFGVFKCFGWYVFDQCPAQGSCQRHRNNAIEFSFERLFSKVRPLKMICWKKCRNSMLIHTES